MALVLVIDDDDLLRATIRRVLGHAGHAVVEAPDGEVGLKLHASHHPDMVISDIIMPTKEGIETIIELRRRDGGLPILAISGGGRIRKADYLEIARKLGATRVLEKPFVNAALLEAVEACLKEGGAKSYRPGTR